MNSSRREALRWALAGALAPALATRLIPVAHAAERDLVVPDTPMRLTRLLTRSLNAAEAIEVRRSWLVEFRRTGWGIAVDGRQVDVQVSVPPKLAPLAQIETRRMEKGVIPLRLDENGLILSEAAPVAGQALDEAVAKAREVIAQQQLSTEREREKLRYLMLMQQSAQSLVSRLPRDLFYPRQLDWHEERALDLPGDLRGELSVRFSASLYENQSLLRQSSRLIETRIGETTRLSSEEWLLDQA